MSWTAPKDHSARSVVSHCIPHTVISATPSFILALAFGWNSAAQILGMILGVAAFATIVTLVHLSRPVLSVMRSSFAARAIRSAKGVRLMHVGFMFICALWNLFNGSRAWLRDFPAPVLLPDLLAGILANGVTDRMGFAPVNPGFTPLRIAPFGTFAQAFTATFIEGWILAFGMGVLCVLFWVLFRLIHLLSPASARESGSNGSGAD